MAADRVAWPRPLRVAAIEGGHDVVATTWWMAEEALLSLIKMKCVRLIPLFRRMLVCVVAPLEVFALFSLLGHGERFRLHRRSPWRGRS